MRLSELSRQLDAQHSSDLNGKLSLTVRNAEQQRMSLLQIESAKIEELIGEAELFKLQSELEIAEKAEEFKRILAIQLEDQRQAHSDEIRRTLLENETRATAMHNAIIAEKDKQNASEKVGWQMA